MKRLAWLLAVMLMACPVMAQQVNPGGGGGGGGSVSVTAGTPNVVITPSPGTGTFTVGSTNIQNSPADGGSHSYTVLSGDATKEVILVSTFTGMAVPQATGSFAAGYSFAGVNKGALTATSTTSTVNGIAGATGIKLGANQFSQWDSDGTNWLVGLGLPQPATQAGTTFLRDDMTWPTVASLGANPTASAGISAVNGTAATFMRSDGAPAIPAATATVAGLVPTPPNDATKYLNGQGAFTVPAGGTSGGGMFGYSDNGLTLTAGTRYVPIYGSGTPSSTEADYATKSPSATTATNLQVNLSADPGAGQTLVVTLRKAGADTALTCTVTGGAGVVCQDLTHSVSVAQNDLIDWKIVTTGTFVATPSVTILANNGTSNVGVTSVGVSVPASSIYGVTSSPVTTSGTIGITTTGTSGGIPYFSSSSQESSSAALTAHGVVVGGGAATAPTSTSAGTAGQVLTSNGVSADPTFQAGGAGALMLIATRTASNSTQLIFGQGQTEGDLSALAYNTFRLDCNALKPGTASGFVYMHVAEGAGPTVKVSGYFWSLSYTNFGSTTVNGVIGSTTAATNVGISPINSSVTADTYSFTADLNLGTAETYRKAMFRGTASVGANAADSFTTNGGGVYTADQTAITALTVDLYSGANGTQLTTTNALVSGQCSLYGYAR